MEGGRCPCVDAPYVTALIAHYEPIGLCHIGRLSGTETVPEDRLSLRLSGGCMSY